MEKEKRDHLDMAIKHVFTRIKESSPKPTECPDEETLAAYREGNLEKEEMERIEEHLAFCGDCTENLIALSGVEITPDSEMKTDLSENVMRKAKDLVRPREKAVFREKVASWFTFSRPVPAMITAALVTVIIVAGIYRFQISPESPTELPTAVKFNLMARFPSGIVVRGEEPKYKEVEIQNGGVLHSGDMFKIRFELKEEAYVYLLSLDSQGSLSILFPAKGADSHIKLKPHKDFVIPSGDKWLRLDENTGTESLYLLASSEEIKDIDLKIDQLREAGVVNIKKIFPGTGIRPFRFRHD